MTFRKCPWGGWNDRRLDITSLDPIVFPHLFGFFIKSFPRGMLNPGACKAVNSNLMAKRRPILSDRKGIMMGRHLRHLLFWI
ncbi:hypothetical protein TNCV_193891 [Trichonephila clavipes]|uniref:Uncharacterized protein n=1 Tax=Trichonephila inaurata madagascariensis TaxID=2747483 RepID=A0A8X6Y9P5_9ARAC|nr:hypothetical protein TNCV_193891 [Trichonephila clavipes]GFY68726.1 hypothetical protein TNIN_53231 [Trichonephila inaurata madagascariensis]